MAYGSVPGVAAHSSTWTSNGTFTSSTDPTVDEVTTWLTEVSASLDMALADFGFITPITDADITPALDGLVNGIVKELVEYSHKSGRFYVKKAMEDSVTPFMVIDKELHEWVARKAIGLEALGAAKNPDSIGRKVASFDLL